MSQAITSTSDLFLTPNIPQVAPLFTTFSAAHFVKPGQYSQPVKAAELASFAGCYTEVFAAEALDLDYEEPNAVCDVEMEVVQAGSAIHQIELPAGGDQTIDNGSDRKQVRAAA